MSDSSDGGDSSPKISQNQQESNQGWIKLHRKLLDHWIATDPCILGIWCWLLLRANHAPVSYLWHGEKINIERGQLITSISKLSSGFSLCRKRAKRVLDLFENEGLIAYQSSNRRTKITICNYEKYQSGKEVLGTTEVTTGVATGVATDAQQKDSRGYTNKNDLRINKNEKECVTSEAIHTQTSVLKLPVSLDTPEHRAALERWIAYSHTKLRKEIGEYEIEALANNWSHRPEELIPAINQSIERGYKSIYYTPPTETIPRSKNGTNGHISVNPRPNRDTVPQWLKDAMNAKAK